MVSLDNQDPRNHKGRMKDIMALARIASSGGSQEPLHSCFAFAFVGDVPVFPTEYEKGFPCGSKPFLYLASLPTLSL